jgi:hypothetical protein
MNVRIRLRNRLVFFPILEAALGFVESSQLIGRDLLVAIIAISSLLFSAPFAMSGIEPPEKTASQVGQNPSEQGSVNRSNVPVASGEAPRAPAARKLISLTKVVGEVGERFVTSREVKIDFYVRLALEIALIAKSPAVAAASSGINIIPWSDSSEAESAQAMVRETDRVLGNWAVFFDAKGFSAQASVTSDELSELEKKTRGIMLKSKAAADWTKLQPTTLEVIQVIERQLITAEYERLKSDTATSTVSDAEALSYFRKNRIKFGTLPFENFKETIKNAIAKQSTESRLKDWRDVLKRKYRIKNYIK